MLNPEVKAQYERYPYPPRNPEDETRMLFPTGMDQLDRLGHHAWGGQRDLSELRVLIAGGGTGDATVYLAEQLTALHPKASPTIVHLDLSESSLNIARARIKARGLDCVTFVQGSLLEARKLLSPLKGPDGAALDQFDYINCSGVLHHLVDPDAGMAALADVLAPKGVMGIMLYGLYGRTGVYQMQTLLRSMFTGQESAEDKVALCHKVLASLPPTNWFARQKDQLMDLQMGDAAIFDLLLHPQDRAYTVEQVYAFVEQANLHFYDFVHLDGTARQHYDPANYWSDPALLQRLQGMTRPQQQGVAELAAGNMLKHSFYCGKEPHSAQNAQIKPASMDGSWIPDFSQRFDVDGDASKTMATQMAANMGEKFNISHSHGKIVVRVNPRILALVTHLDGHNSIDTIVEKAHQDLSPNKRDAQLHTVLRQDLGKLCDALGYYEWVFIRAPHVPRAPRMKSLQIATVQRLKTR